MAAITGCTGTERSAASVFPSEPQAVLAAFHVRCLKLADLAKAHPCRQSDPQHVRQEGLIAVLALAPVVVIPEKL
jgi:hypothetical protein